MQFQLIPLIQVGVPPAELKANGYFYYFDYFDVMILLDFLTFVCMVFYMWIYMISAIYPTRNMRMLMHLNSGETRSQDFLNTEVWARNLIIQLFSYFTLSIFVVILVRWDPV